MKIDLQISLDGEWASIATCERSAVSGGWLEYDHAYVVDQKDSPHNRAGLLYPVNFDIHSFNTLPAFVVDILPAGAGRRVWLKRLDKKDGESVELDWELLSVGAGNPPGNLRVRQSVIEPPEPPHVGFSMDDIVAKKSDFIEYAEEMGAVVTGATDIPGDAPKFAVVTDVNGKWHPDGALRPEMIVSSWIVKFPRGKQAADKLILRNEAQYYEVARWFGIRTGDKLAYRDNCLFVPRFDRERSGNKLLRHGLETLCSVANISEYGRRGDHLTFCHAIATVATAPAAEIMEYLKRDILNAAMRNVDNHGRNTAFLKRRGGPIELSPLYDFDPMSLDPEGIPRASLWHGMESAGRPDWVAVAKSLEGLVDVTHTIKFLSSQASKVARIPAVMKQLGVEGRVIEEVAARCEAIAGDLEKAGNI